MAFRFFNTNIVGAGVAITAVANDAILIAANTSIVSTSTDSISSFAANVSVQVDGLVAGAAVGIALSGTGRNSVTISAEGRVTGGIQQAISISGGTFGELVNFGDIRAFTTSNNSSTFYVGTETAYVFNGGVIIAGDGNFDAVNFLGGGSTAINRFINTGSIVSSTNTGVGGVALAFTGNDAGGASDLVTNTGQIVGDINLNAGADSYDGRGGRLLGSVLGGGGNDTVYGGFGADQLLGEADSDSIYFDAEDLTHGNVNGGAGYDTGYYTDNNTPITINLTTQGFEAYFGSAADELVFSGSLGGFGAFARFGAGNDTWDGSAQADNVDGGTGVDVLYGRAGADVIAGGNGGDWLSGGAGADTFDYNSLTESSASASDFIADFSTAQGDKIDLSGVTLGLATFNSGYGVGTSVYIFAGGGGTTLVQVYSLATLDMQIVVNQASLAAGDFLL